MKKDRAKVDIFMPIYVGDYLADTSELSAEEHGAYLLLMMGAWRRGGRLPVDPTLLSRIAAVSRPRWPRVWGMIERFFDVDGDALVQRRVTRELAIAMGKKETASRKGLSGAEARWGSARVNAQPSGTGMPQASAKESVTDGISPSPSEAEIPSEGDPPLPPKFSGVDPLTVNGLIAIITAEVERAQPDRGLYQPGQWAMKSARAFCEAIPVAQRNDVTRAEIRRRARAFAASTDKRITRETWLVEHFCEAYNALAPKGQAKDPVIESVMSKSGGRPYLPPEKGVVRGAG